MPSHSPVICVSQAFVLFQHRWNHLLFGGRGLGGRGRVGGRLSSAAGEGAREEGSGRGGGLGLGGLGCTVSRFKQAENKRPVERKVRGRQSVYNLAYCDSFFT